MKFNLLIAISIALALTVWMVVGSTTASEETARTATEPVEKELPSVRYRDSEAQPFEARITLRGKTQPSQSSLLKAEVAGPVLEIVAERGSRVAKGATLMRLDPRNLPQQLEATRALVKQRELEYEAAKKLQASGFQSETRAAEAESMLAAARNDFAATRIALENTEIKAPYDGVFNDRLVEVGEFVSIGDPIASFFALDPLVVEAEATEAEMRRIGKDSKAFAKIGDITIDGSIRYLSKSGNESVRTYTVEFAFENGEHRFQAGITADIVIATESQLAHKVTPAILFLSANTEGDLGIKTIEEDGTVGFYKAKILGSEPDGVWISGLPKRARIITVGQGYVKPGLPVKGVDESTIQ